MNVTDDITNEDLAKSQDNVILHIRVKSVSISDGGASYTEFWSGVKDISIILQTDEPFGWHIAEGMVRPGKYTHVMLVLDSVSVSLASGIEKGLLAVSDSDLEVVVPAEKEIHVSVSEFGCVRISGVAGVIVDINSEKWLDIETGELLPGKSLFMGACSRQVPTI